MRFKVNFKDLSEHICVNFKEATMVSDGGYERGYAEGFNDGQFLWKYAKSLTNMFEYSEFPKGTQIVLNVPQLSVKTMNYVFRSATGVEYIKLKCIMRDTPMHWHSAFSRCYDLKVIDLTEFNTNFNASSDVFYGCLNLEEIRGEINNTTNNWTLWFTSCAKLREVRFKPNSIIGTFNIGNSPLLSQESIQSIIDGLANLIGSASSTLIFNKDVKGKLTEDQLGTITTKNWILG